MLGNIYKYAHEGMCTYVHKQTYNTQKKNKINTWENKKTLPKIAIF